MRMANAVFAQRGAGVISPPMSRIRRLARCCSCDAPATVPSPQQKTPPERGFREERMKGLEPSTFCMASRRSSQLSYIRVGRQYSRGSGVLPPAARFP